MFGKQQIGAISWSRVCSSARAVPESTSEPVEAETFQFLWATPQSRNSELTAITVQTDCYQNKSNISEKIINKLNFSLAVEELPPQAA